jgi:CRISPR-associated protein Cas1
MIKKTLEISTEGVFLSTKQKQLLIHRQGNQPASIPCEDIGLILLDSCNSTVSFGALNELIANQAALVICGKNHLPAGMLVPFSQHNLLLERLHTQINLSKPLKKQAWKILIREKILHQARLLEKSSAAYNRLQLLANEIRSGDPDNYEAQAAAMYWKHFLPESYQFRRDADGDGINGLLNYGYAVFRASIARACIMAGLLPALGIHHHNRSNAFCLADDLIEPIRPMIDSRVRALTLAGHVEITPYVKKELLSLLQVAASVGESTGPLGVQIHQYVAGFVRFIQGETTLLGVPKWNFLVTGSCG